PGEQAGRARKKARPRERSRGAGPLAYGLLRGDYLDRDGRGDLGVERHGDAVAAEGLDVAGELDAAAGGRGGGGGLPPGRGVPGGDRAEEAAAVAGARGQAHGQRLQLAADLLGVAQVADLPGAAGPLDRGDLLLAALGPRDREAARHQVVTAVAVTDLDDVAGRAEA